MFGIFDIVQNEISFAGSSDVGRSEANHLFQQNKSDDETL